MVTPIDSKISVQKVVELLSKTRACGIKIHYHNGELLLKVPKGTSIDSSIINELKAHKQSVIEYMTGHSHEMKEETTIAPVIFDNVQYFGISTIERYWVDPTIDKEYKTCDKGHGPVGKRLKVSGQLDPNIFTQAVAHVLSRHESLRATFHLFAGQYYMKVHNSYDPSAIEVRDAYNADSSDLSPEDFIAFKEHQFDLQSGPILITRLIKVGEDNFLMAVRAHHVIMDSWAWEVLIRDFFISYGAFAKGQVPPLAPLKYQLKDYMHKANAHRTSNYQSDMAYWHKIYPSQPVVPIIPGAMKTFSPLADKIGRAERGVFPDHLAQRLNSASGYFSSSLFIILQATFKSFFSKKTGLYDITIGTYVHGRNEAGSENQIGCFAKCALVRTVLAKDESFAKAVMKVSEANEAMRNHTACSLEEFLESVYGFEQPVRGGIWKINLLYTDIHNGQQKQNEFEQHLQSVKLSLQEIPTSPIIPVDMQWEFISHKTHLELLVDYDSSLYQEEVIKNFITEYYSYTEQFIQDQVK